MTTFVCRVQTYTQNPEKKYRIYILQGSASRSENGNEIFRVLYVYAWKSNESE